jgi:hypothetical protein
VVSYVALKGDQRRGDKTHALEHLEFPNLTVMRKIPGSKTVKFDQILDHIQQLLSQCHALATCEAVEKSTQKTNNSEEMESGVARD